MYIQYRVVIYSTHHNSITDRRLFCGKISIKAEDGQPTHNTTHIKCPKQSTQSAAHA